MISNKKKRGALIVVSGPSGVGKGTVLKAWMQEDDNLFFSVSATTRSPREGEEHGVQYYFYDRALFLQMIENGEMLEYAEYNGNYYGTPASVVEKMRDEGKDVLLEIETKGALKVKEKVPDALLIMILPPSYEELEKRLRGRGTEDDATVRNRLAIAFDEIKKAEQYDFAVINREVAETAAQLKQIIAVTRLKNDKTNLISEVL